MRAAASASSRRNVTKTATGVVALTRSTVTPAANPLPSPIATSSTKKSAAPGGCPAT
ncbi:MAG: hypothetical protein H0V49_08655 [Nocardioidaceae bacterium]|nr:hypothetical protein [Nocardioidaceae bacterium]